MSTLLQSRRFWTFILAQTISIISLIVAHYVHDPFGTQLAALVVALIEGTAVFLIGAYTVEDTASSVAAVKAGVHPNYPPVAQPAAPIQLPVSINIQPQIPPLATASGEPVGPAVTPAPAPPTTPPQ